MIDFELILKAAIIEALASLADSATGRQAEAGSLTAPHSRSPIATTFDGETRAIRRNANANYRRKQGVLSMQIGFRSYQLGDDPRAIPPLRRARGGIGRPSVDFEYPTLPIREPAVQAGFFQAIKNEAMFPGQGGNSFSFVLTPLDALDPDHPLDYHVNDEQRELMHLPQVLKAWPDFDIFTVPFPHPFAYSSGVDDGVMYTAGFHKKRMPGYAVVNNFPYPLYSGELCVDYPGRLGLVTTNFPPSLTVPSATDIFVIRFNGFQWQIQEFNGSSWAVNPALDVLEFAAYEYVVEPAGTTLVDLGFAEAIETIPHGKFKRGTTADENLGTLPLYVHTFTPSGSAWDFETPIVVENNTFSIDKGQRCFSVNNIEEAFFQTWNFGYIDEDDNLVAGDLRLLEAYSPGATRLHISSPVNNLGQYRSLFINSLVRIVAPGAPGAGNKTYFWVTNIDKVLIGTSPDRYAWYIDIEGYLTPGIQGSPVANTPLEIHWFAAYDTGDALDPATTHYDVEDEMEAKAKRGWVLYPTKTGQRLGLNNKYGHKCFGRRDFVVRRRYDNGQPPPDDVTGDYQVFSKVDSRTMSHFAPTWSSNPVNDFSSGPIFSFKTNFPTLGWNKYDLEFLSGLPTIPPFTYDGGSWEFHTTWTLGGVISTSFYSGIVKACYVKTYSANGSAFTAEMEAEVDIVNPTILTDSARGWSIPNPLASLSTMSIELEGVSVANERFFAFCILNEGADVYGVVLTASDWKVRVGKNGVQIFEGTLWDFFPSCNRDPETGEYVDAADARVNASTFKVINFYAPVTDPPTYFENSFPEYPIREPLGPFDLLPTWDFYAPWLEHTVGRLALFNVRLRNPNTDSQKNFWRKQLEIDNGGPPPIVIYTRL